MEFTQGNETIVFEIETSGLTYDEYIAEPTSGTFETICPEETNYTLNKDTDDRNPICMKGKVQVITSKTLEVSLSGAVDIESPAMEFLHSNLLTVDYVLGRITDNLIPDKPKVYIGWFSVSTNEFPRSGGSTVEFNLELSSGQYSDITPVTPAV